MIKAVIFDLDGTLVDSLGDICNSTNYALKKYNFPEHPRQVFNYFVGNGVPKLIERSIPKSNFNQDVYKKVHTAFIEHYSEHFLDNTVVFDGIKESLEALKQAKIGLAVLSNKREDFTLKIMEKLFCGEFSQIFGKRENYPLKPDPTSTLDIIKELGVNPNECAFLGDSGVDMQVAVNAGCLPVGVLWGLRTKEELLQNGAKYLIENPKDIAPFILGLKNEN